MAETFDHTGSRSLEQGLPALRFSITLEAVLYIVLGISALLLRLAELGSAPLNDAEAREALAAWHFIGANAPGTSPLATSPLMFAVNSLHLALFGGAAWVARLGTVVAGTLLVLTPALWRRELGRSAALGTAALLTISPVTLLASRTMSPVIWSMLLLVVGLWLVWRFQRTGREGYALAAAVVWLSAVLLADPFGWLLLVILLVALLVTLRASSDLLPEDHPAARVRELVTAWPWAQSAVYGGVTLILVATLFFIFPRGLAQVGALVEHGIAGLFTLPAGYVFAWPVLVSLLYEPVLWFLGGLGVSQATRRGDFIDNFLIGWLFGALLAAFIVAGAGPSASLWLTIPLAALGGRALARLLTPVVDAYWAVPRWAVPLIMVVVLALLFITATNFIWVARGLANYNPADPMAAVQPLRLLLTGMSILLLLILFFLAASLWGSNAAGRGFALGIALFLSVYSLSTGWGAAVTRLDDPRELWHGQPVSRNLSLLRETVAHGSLRDTGGPQQVEIVAQIEPGAAVAWQLRDYPNVRFTPIIDQRVTAPVLITGEGFQPEALGARYVGQDLVLTQAWSLDSLNWWDIPNWIMFRDVSAMQPYVNERVVIWLRDDIYGLPPLNSDDEQGIGEEITP